jgi:hypothetical protein
MTDEHFVSSGRYGVPATLPPQSPEEIAARVKRTGANEFDGNVPMVPHQLPEDMVVATCLVLASKIQNTSASEGESDLVGRWRSLREMQAQRALGQTPMEERAMANREQRSNREKKKPKKDEPKGGTAISSFTTESSKAAGKKK